MGGKHSRNKGAAFERRCKKIMARILPEFPYWKRSSDGQHQYFGDLVPTDKKGEQVSLDYFVECKHYGTITKGLIDGWLKVIREDAGDKKWVLLMMQDRGPVMIYTCEEISDSIDHLSNTTVNWQAGNNQVIGPVYITFER